MKNLSEDVFLCVFRKLEKIQCKNMIFQELRRESIYWIESLRMQVHAIKNHYKKSF